MSNRTHLTRVPELDARDEAAFDCNALWHSSIAPKPAVLIVDDNPVIAEMVHRLLQYLVTDHTIIVETEPAALLPHLQTHTVPLVISDFSMPQINGLDLTTQIKAISPQTRVLLMSAFACANLERQALAQRVDFYLPKPFQFANLKLKSSRRCLKRIEHYTRPGPRLAQEQRAAASHLSRMPVGPRSPAGAGGTYA